MNAPEPAVQAPRLRPMPISELAAQLVDAPFIIFGEEGYAVAMCTLELAPLVSAAPELLAALKRIEDGSFIRSMEPLEVIERMQEIARAAVYKAEGGSGPDMFNFELTPAPAKPALPPEEAVRHQFMHWLLVDPEEGVIRFATAAERPAIRAVADLHERALRGDVVLDEEWAAARAAARAAALAAARAAAGAAARDAAWAAARDAARAAARDAARAAARDAAGAAARDAAGAAAWDAAWAAARDAARDAAWAAAAWDAAWDAARLRQQAKLADLCAALNLDRISVDLL